MDPHEAPASHDRRPLRDRVLGVIAPLLLIVVASTQVVVASTSDLTPWRGGGFGMFSTLDTHDQRILRVTITAADAEGVPVDPAALLSDGAALREVAVTARNHPTSANLEGLAASVAEAELSVVDGVAVPASRDAAAAADGSRLGAIEIVRVAVWRTAFDREAGLLVPELLVDRELRP
ncbi:MAG: hypothetical protein WD638_01140 [Nitriliruptoraceae bacterium]